MKTIAVLAFDGETPNGCTFSVTSPSGEQVPAICNAGVVVEDSHIEESSSVLLSARYSPMLIGIFNKLKEVPR